MGRIENLQKLFLPREEFYESVKCSMVLTIYREICKLPLHGSEKSKLRREIIFLSSCRMTGRTMYADCKR